ncbi:hypothetical protein EON77_16785, partial [bacterium]
MRHLTSFSLLLVTGATFAQTTHTETEPNDLKGSANFFNIRDTSTGLGRGDLIAGVAGPGDVDRFRLNVASTYSYQVNTLRLDRPSSSGGLHGLSLKADGTADATSDPLVQPTAPSGFDATSVNSFISFGSDNREVQYEVSGTGANTLYTSRLAQTQFFAGQAIPYAGTFRGAITITAGSQTIDSDIALFGTSYQTGQPVMKFFKANNDASADTLGSRIVSDYQFGGDFYVAISDRNLVTGVLPDADEFARAANDPRTHVFGETGLLAASSDATIAIPLTIS